MSEAQKKEIEAMIESVVMKSHQAVAKVQSEHLSVIQKDLKSLNGYGKIMKFLRTDLGMILAICSFASVVLGGYYSIANDLNSMRYEIRNIDSDTETIKSSLKEQAKSFSDLAERVSKIEGFLDHKKTP